MYTVGAYIDVRDCQTPGQLSYLSLSRLVSSRLVSPRLLGMFYSFLTWPIQDGYTPARTLGCCWCCCLYYLSYAKKPARIFTLRYGVSLTIYLFPMTKDIWSFNCDQIIKRLIYSNLLFPYCLPMFQYCTAVLGMLVMDLNMRMHWRFFSLSLPLSLSCRSLTYFTSLLWSNLFSLLVSSSLFSTVHGR